MPYDDHIITQVATGLFGVREETIQRVPDRGVQVRPGREAGSGRPPPRRQGDTPAWPRMREAVAGSALFSPFPFHSVYSVEDHKKHVDWIKEINPQGPGLGEGLDPDRRGHGGGGELLRRRAHRPARRQLRRHRRGAGHRQEEHRHAHRVRHPEGAQVPHGRRASATRSPSSPAAASAPPTTWPRPSPWAPTACVIGTAEMVALECIRCHHCESGRGCAARHRHHRPGARRA
ncbi:MAG: glutamate synthase-related protein [Comamonadaceae bacterium]|nr:glutamate synthase-related protein [Comamonadaceae bacterium]